MNSESLRLFVNYRANIARQLGVPNVSFLNYDGMRFFLLNTLMRGLEKRSAKKFILEIAQWIASKHVRLVRDKTAKEAEELCASGQCAAALLPLQKAIYLGHLPSRALKAWLMIEGREGVAKDHNTAFELVEEGARFGCHHCQGVMADCYLRGYGIQRDFARSLELARESSEKGSRYGQYILGWLYLNGAGGVAQDNAQAVALYQLAAAQNLDEAQCNLGFMYEQGFGVAKDYAEALRLYLLAAAQGCPLALYYVGIYYEDGRCVRQNKAEAICWYRRAQAAGNPYVAYHLKRLCA
jgi:TPR repeat protein